jgi:hypothetical protein
LTGSYQVNLPDHTRFFLSFFFQPGSVPVASQPDPESTYQIRPGFKSMLSSHPVLELTWPSHRVIFSAHLFLYPVLESRSSWTRLFLYKLLHLPIHAWEISLLFFPCMCYIFVFYNYNYCIANNLQEIIFFLWKRLEAL